MTFIDKSILAIAEVVRMGYVQWETSSKRGLFQMLDPRVKVVFMLCFIVMVSLLRDPYVETAIALFIFALILLSRLNIFTLYKRILFFAFFFGFLVALPSAFNVITRGDVILPVAHLSRSYQFWIYSLPKDIGLTREGCFGVCMLTLRVMNSVAISLLVMHTTPFFEVIRALKVLRIPDTFLMIIILSYKYIFIFSKTVEDMYRAMKSRLIGPMRSGTIRSLIAGRIFIIFKKSGRQYEETFKAMVARGFTGEIVLSGFHSFTARDAIAGIVLAAVGILFIMMGKVL